MTHRILATICALMLATTVQAGETLRLAVTTSFHNSGLADVLLPVIAKDLNLDVQLLVVGTGQALKLGERGDVDAILVHSRVAEDEFIAQGFGTHRREIMYNDFVLIGPDTDPANIQNATSAADALQKIASAELTFVSRGDDSGTHKKEVSLWNAAGLDPEQFAPWYTSVGAGMGAALNTAAGKEAYIMSDRASWLNFANKSTLALLYSGDPVLFNQYTYIPVNPVAKPHIKNGLAGQLESWLVSTTAKELIDGYKINGEALFVFNAKD